MLFLCSHSECGWRSSGVLLVAAFDAKFKVLQCQCYKQAAKQPPGPGLQGCPQAALTPLGLPAGTDTQVCVVSVRYCNCTVDLGNSRQNTRFRTFNITSFRIPRIAHRGGTRPRPASQLDWPLLRRAVVGCNAPSSRTGLQVVYRTTATRTMARFRTTAALSSTLESPPCLACLCSRVDRNRRCIQLRAPARSSPQANDTQRSRRRNISIQ